MDWFKRIRQTFVSNTTEGKGIEVMQYPPIYNGKEVKWVNADPVFIDNLWWVPWRDKPIFTHFMNLFPYETEGEARKAIQMIQPYLSQRQGVLKAEVDLLKEMLALQRSCPSRHSEVSLTDLAARLKGRE